MTKWKYGLQTLMDSISFKLTLFVFIAIMMFVVGLMTGFIINHDNVLNTFNLRFGNISSKQLEDITNGNNL